MGPFRVREFPRNYPALLAVSTSCFLRYNKWCILGVNQEVEPLCLEEGELFLRYQKDVKKILSRRCSFKEKCELYDAVVKKYDEFYEKHGCYRTEAKVHEPDNLVEEEEDQWEDSFEEISMEETGTK
ncbi:movement protein [Beet curly top Iran virus]|uniref:Movement protein n=1 Tax=Beet curly top Iran virus TaxID=391228 RepID=L7XA52_9GEMI|nr:movement protein [Beet curly top Iran virus]WGT85318.1 movement protein [Beet curly top Iran virus]